jgi:hypothetical protein
MLAAESSLIDHETLGVISLSTNNRCVSEENLEWDHLKEINIVFNYSKV